MLVLHLTIFGAVFHKQIAVSYTHLDVYKRQDLHTKTDMGKKTILLMGNEQSGIDDDLAGKCDALIKLPMKGRADSLNLAIATGVCLYEIWRQRDFNGRRIEGGQ